MKVINLIEHWDRMSLVFFMKCLFCNPFAFQMITTTLTIHTVFVVPVNGHSALKLYALEDSSKCGILNLLLPKTEYWYRAAS